MSISIPVSEEVGSPIMSSRAHLESARAISTICCCAMVSPGCGEARKRRASSGLFSSTLAPSMRIRPGGGRIDAGDDVHEDGFAGAVLADQTMHLSPPDFEIHPVQGKGPGEALGQGLACRKYSLMPCSPGSWPECCSPRSRR